MAHWRLQIFEQLLLVVLLLGGATAIPSVLLAASEGLWLVAVIDTVSIAVLVAVWRWRALGYVTRVIIFLSIAFAVGGALMLKDRPVSQIYLAAVPVLAALLLGLRPALGWLAASGAAVLAIGLSVGQGMLLRPAIIALNFLFITGIITLSCAYLLRHLAHSLAAVSATAAAMEAGRNALHALNHELRLTSAALARLNDMVLIAAVGEPDAAGAAAQSIIFVNEAFERRTGYLRAELLGRPLRMLSGPGTSSTTLARIDSAMARYEPVRAELLNYTRSGETYWVETDMVPLADDGGKHTHWLVVERDITERRKSEDDIHRLAFYDVLTGLPNRRLLMDRIDKLLDTSSRDASFGAVMFIDLDHFKDINDARGHAVGDALLRYAAARLADLVRKGDTVARIGGDEFVVLLPGLGADATDAAHRALMLAEKIRAAIARPFSIDHQSYQCSASLGATLFPGTGNSAQDLLREADTAMYRAKAEGRNGVVFYEGAMQADVEQRLTLARNLQLALEEGQLEMYYQPQFDRSRRIAGAELLMRWRRPDGTMVPPAIFIPIAEQTGLIQQLGHWAMRQACLAVVALDAAGQRLPLSVNVSPSQFRQADFVDQVRATLAETGAPADLLILEVTEGLLIDKFDETVSRMRALAALGLRFSIDDFGTGYSSLAYLRRMPLYELKIDRSFIQDMPDDANAIAIVQAMLAMAGHLGLRVVAEGVETEAQASFLNEAGCDCLQGYLLARPAPFADLLAALR